MRPLFRVLVGVAPVLVLLACSGDQQATTAPTTTPTFAKTGNTFVSADAYSFSLSCHSSSPTSHASGTLSNGATFSLGCGGSETHGQGSGDGHGSFTSFDYSITLNDATPTITCSQTGVTTDGSFKCSFKKWAATLTVTDLGVITPP